jgi:arsenite methyltransferase
METSGKEKIRNAVRESYGNVARSGGMQLNASAQGSCCGTGTTPATDPGACGCGSSDIGPEQISALLGYSQKDLDNVPTGANLGLGCGNPQAIAALQPGETVVDLGSGGGFDCFLAARAVGHTGRVIGVDMTADMISRARLNKEKVAAENVEFRLGEIEHLPVADNRADLIMSNCVINLSPEKQKVYDDAFRVLKPGGRLAISDIVALKPLPDEIKKDLDLVSACVGGAATIADTENLLKRAGFEHIQITPVKVSQALIDEWLPGSKVGEYVASASIVAKKP